MKIETIQKGIIDWFWLNPNEKKSMNSIQNVCSKLYQQFFPTRIIKNAKYELIYPLLKFGILEFYGNGNLRLSPSCILCSNKFLVSCNIHDSLDLTSSRCVLNLNFGIRVFEAKSNYLFFVKRMGLPYSNFQFSDTLRAIKSFESIITSWSSSSIIDTKNFFSFSKNYAWINCRQPLQNGIYKKNKHPYSQKVVLLKEYLWKDIPDTRQNIDAFNIAAIWSHISNNWEIGVEYNLKQSKLIVKNIYFPILLERQLFLNTLLEGAFDFDFFHREYFIKQKEFCILNELFSQKIQIV